MISRWCINMNGHARAKALRAAFLVDKEGEIVYSNMEFKARGKLRCVTMCYYRCTLLHPALPCFVTVLSMSLLQEEFRHCTSSVTSSSARPSKEDERRNGVTWLVDTTS